jgi:hemoglobin
MNAKPATEEDVRNLVVRFYERARADALLGPVFNEAVHDWPAHIERIVDFWSDAILRTDRYHGTPMGPHLQLTKLEPAMFARWLDLFGDTARESLPADVAEATLEHAKRIARSLSYGVFQYRPASAPPLEKPPEKGK